MTAFVRALGSLFGTSQEHEGQLANLLRIEYGRDYRNMRRYGIVTEKTAQQYLDGVNFRK
jgi:hypothetical protein